MIPAQKHETQLGLRKTTVYQFPYEEEYKQCRMDYPGGIQERPDNLHSTRIHRAPAVSWPPAMQW